MLVQWRCLSRVQVCYFCLAKQPKNQLRLGHAVFYRPTLIERLQVVLKTSIDLLTVPVLKLKLSFTYRHCLKDWLCFSLKPLWKDKS